MQRSVVVVDDDADIRGAILEILEGEGLEAFGVADGQEALDYIRQQSGRVGLVLLDARMPGLDGESFLRIRVQDPAVRDTPVIVFTADRDLEPVIQAFPLTSYLRKPCALKELLEVVLRKLEF